MSSRNQTALEYVFHPVNAFNLLKRTYSISEHINLLISLIPNLKPNLEYISYYRNNILKDYIRAHHGLADLHEYIGISPNDIANGRLADPNSNVVYKSRSTLTIEDLVKIAEEAKKVKYQEGCVNWLRAALTLCKGENNQAKEIDIR